MKKFIVFLLPFLTFLLFGCSSTQKASALKSPLSRIEPGMAKQEVYGILGSPIREGEREAEWYVPEKKSGMLGTSTWRAVTITFDEHGRVAVVRGHEEQK
jgi:outer membrane protein assembly factor BamE (lipoprotein component of BamABCDE complex)